MNNQTSSKGEKEQKKVNFVLWLLGGFSVVLILYTSIYIWNYYTENNILCYIPKNIKSDNTKLAPNELGDSIGGILNPIIGITASILTFLAFYLQYKANIDQREFFYEGLKNESNKLENEKKDKIKEEIKFHISNIKILKILLVEMVDSYMETGKNLLDYLDKETKTPLSFNLYKVYFNSSYYNYQKLDFQSIYNSISFGFNSMSQKWEKEFLSIINKIDFYDKILNELSHKISIHTNSKAKTINFVGEEYQKKIVVIRQNEYLNILLESTLNDCKEFIDKFNLKLQEEINYEEFRTEIIVKLLLEFRKQSTVPRNKIFFDEILYFFNDLDQKLIYEKTQSISTSNLYKKDYYDKYFTKGNEEIKKIEDFIVKLDTVINNLETKI